MTVQEIFNTIEIRRIEIEILLTIEENDRRWCSNNAYALTLQRKIQVLLR